MTDTPYAEKPVITSASLPAILIGGPPKAGKSVITYNLTRELLELDVPHYTFRASPDGEGNWFLKGNREVVISLREQSKRGWSDIFRQLASQDIPQRQLPLLVDLGGRPKDEDRGIFQACTHVILLLKEKDGPDAKLWHSYIKENKLERIAEIYTQQSGQSTLTAVEPVVTGTLTLPAKERIRERMSDEIFQALLKRTRQVLGVCTHETLEHTRIKLEAWHLSQAPQGFLLVNLPERFHKLFPAAHDTYEWTPRALQQLLTQIPAQQPLAVYGSGPAWLYGALALHASAQPFYQFDARFGWRTPPSLLPGTPGQATLSMLRIDRPRVSDDIYTIVLTPEYGYLNYDEVKELVLPEPPQQGGVIISGKLPLWFFTALARFYAQRDVSWIALYDANDNVPVVIYSKVTTYPLGKKISIPKF